MSTPWRPPAPAAALVTAGRTPRGPVDDHSGGTVPVAAYGGPGSCALGMTNP